MINDVVNIGDRVICIKQDDNLNITKDIIYEVTDIWNNMLCVVNDRGTKNYYYKLYFDKFDDSKLKCNDLNGKETIPEKEMVNHPDHYKGNKFEVIDIIEDYNLDFSIGNAVKYLLRAGKKDNTVQDLKKAIWYIEREIKNLENSTK